MKKFNFILALVLAGALLPAVPAAAEAGLEELRREIRQMRAEVEARERRLAELEAKVARFEAPVRPDYVEPGRPDGASWLPDISVIGDIRGEFGSGETNNLYLEELELALGGFIYPEVRADAFIAIHKHGDDYDFELEEAYVNFLNLGGGFAGQAGRKLVGFGKLNPVHPHAWDFATRPLVLGEFLGDHGLAGNGVNLTWLAPTPFFLQLEAGAWLVAEDDDDHDHGHSHGVIQDKTVTARLWSGFEAGANADLEIGLSALRGGGPHYADPLFEVRGGNLHLLSRNVDVMKVYGLDLTYRRAFEGFRRLLLRGEYLQAHRRRQRFGLDAVEDADGIPLPIPVPYPGGAVRDAMVRSSGFYASANWRWSQHWDAGIRYDRARDPLSVSDSEQAVTAALTRALTEETKVRAQFSHDLSGGYTGILQFVFGIGPHAHPLE